MGILDRLVGGGPSMSERWQRVEETPRVPAGKMRPGAVAVQGTASENDGTVETPIGSESALLVQYEKRRRTSGGRYSVVERRVEAVPFLLEDNTGAVLVDPTAGGDPTKHAPYPLSGGNTTVYAGPEDPFDDAAAIRPIETDGAVPAGGGAVDVETGAGDPPEWLHVQSVVYPGDTVYVLGAGTERDGGLIIAPGDVFVLSDMRKPALEQHLESLASTGADEALPFALLGLIVVLGVLIVLAIVLMFFVL